MVRFTYLSATLWLIGLISLSGCQHLQHEVNPSRLHNEASKLVVTCFLSPQDQVLAVKVTRTRSILGEQVATGDSNVVDATVRLSEGSRSVGLRYDPTEQYYRAAVAQLPIVVGRTYDLLVQTPAGEAVTATCTVPGPVRLASTTFDSLTAEAEQTNRSIQRYFVRARWQDPATQSNFYQVTGLFRFVVNCPSCEKNPAYQPREQTTQLYFDNLEGTLQNDYSNGGSTMTSEPAFLTNVSAETDQQPGFRSQYKAATVVMNLLNTDRNYYRYQNAVVRQAEVRDNPFAEPVPIPTNIQGGLGCFGAYNRSTLTVRLR